MNLEWMNPAAFLGSILFALIGVVVFWVSFIVIDKLTPYDLWKELVENRNMALGLVVAAMSLGMLYGTIGCSRGLWRLSVCRLTIPRSSSTSFGFLTQRGVMIIPWMGVSLIWRSIRRCKSMG